MSNENGSVTVATDFTKPHDVSDALLAFPGSVRHLMPPREDCEAALKAMPDGGRGWRQFQSQWFFEGISKNAVKPKTGIDADRAFRHLATIQGSYEPEHEHKEAAVAYLASLWFEKPPKVKGLTR
jgi:hypothetical protein